jgi:chromosome segregation ATPase
MQVKDYIQALTDEGKVHVEKIGSGNWYWAWAGEEKQARERQRETLQKELAKCTRGVDEVRSKITALNEEIERERGGGDAEDEREQRKGLINEKTRLEKEVGQLQAEVDRFTAADGAAGVESKERDIREWKAAAEMWTDNLYVLEGYLKKLAGGNMEVLDAVRRECYGDEYVEGEGLRDLDG